jgi:hypothetical protein
VNGSQTTGQRSSMPNRSVLVGGLRRDPVDHRVREPHLALDPVSELLVAQPRERGEREPRERAVALQVVARHDRERRHAALAPAAQRRGDQAERRPRRRARLEVGGHVADRVELAAHGVDAVAALGHGQRHDPRLRHGEPLDHRLGVVRGEQVLGDRADHPRLVGAVGVLDHQRVEAVLRVERLLHAPVGRHHADAADAPVERFAVVHQAVVVGRLMRPVEAADAEVHDAGGDARAVVRRPRHRRRGQRAHLIAPSVSPRTR